MSDRKELRAEWDALKQRAMSLGCWNANRWLASPQRPEAMLPFSGSGRSTRRSPSIVKAEWTAAFNELWASSDAPPGVTRP